MENKKMKGADYLLVLLYLNEMQPIFGAVRLEKMMFLFEKEIAKVLKNKGLESEKLANFFAYNYGPFSKDVYDQTELFKSIGFLKITNLNSKEELDEADDWEENAFVDEIFDDETKIIIPDNKYMKYEITELGANFVKEKLLNKITLEQRKILELFKQKITDTSIKQLLHYVYLNYPEFAENSLIKGEIFGNE